MRKPSGLEFHYWGYAGGAPRINVDPNTGAYVEPYSAAYWRRYADLKENGPAPPAHTLARLVAQYKASVVASMKPDMKRAAMRYLKVIEAEWWDCPIVYVDAKRFRADVIAWRDSMASKPRSADYAVSTLSGLLEWARDRGEIGANPAANIDRLHSADRSNIVVTADELARQRAAATPAAALAFLIASKTALRRTDLAKTLTWSTYDGTCIKLVPSKSRTRKRPGGRVIVIPLDEDTRAILDALPREGTHILMTDAGCAWTPGGLTKAWDRARAGYGKRLGTGIDKRLHDLRGTAITHLYGLGVDIDDLAAIAGWSAQSVRDVIKLYVGDQALVGRVLAAVRRGNQKLKPGLKLVPNPGNEEDENTP